MEWFVCLCVSSVNDVFVLEHIVVLNIQVQVMDKCEDEFDRNAYNRKGP